MSLPPLRSSWWLLALLGACAAPPDPALEARQIVVRLEPAEQPLQLRVDRFGSIFWFLPEEVATAGEVRVAIDGGLEPSSTCSTTYGFELPQMGQRRSAPLRPGAGAVICFHDAGEFAFRVEGLAQPLSGVVKVGGLR
ncbi:MAG: hypothetical protein JNM84_08600 [Planctomycetes bacterium]|nr:hypothetical protein [Planctomycetota bacterium]